MKDKSIHLTKHIIFIKYVLNFKGTGVDVFAFPPQ